MQTDDAMKDSKETATPFNVSQTITRERSFSLQSTNQNPRECCIATVEQLYSWSRHTDTHSYRIPRAAMPRGILIGDLKRKIISNFKRIIGCLLEHKRIAYM